MVVVVVVVVEEEGAVGLGRLGSFSSFDRMMTGKRKREDIYLPTYPPT